MPLYLFCGSTFAAVALGCGIISTTPAYEAALFGSKNVGAVHGRMLLFNSMGAVAGPALFVNLRSRSELSAMQDLLTKVDPKRFEAQFGVGTDQAQGLIDAKTLSIAKLMELLPPETLAITTDPTPFIYDTSWQAIAGLVCVSAVSHNMIRPVDLSKYQGNK